MNATIRQAGSGADARWLRRGWVMAAGAREGSASDQSPVGYTPTPLRLWFIRTPIDIRWERRKLLSTSDVNAIPRFILNKMMKIMAGGLDDPHVQALLAHHFSTAHSMSPPGSAHALDLSGLRQPDVSFWSGWDGERVITIGALKRFSGSEGEIKSMHTEESYRRKGAGSMMLRHIIARARQMGLSRLNLETGAQPYFNPARELYKRHGFVQCPPFGSYVSDENSVFMTLALGPKPHARPTSWI